MTSAVKIRLASRAYDGVLPILRGQMAIAGLEFDITKTEDVPGMFAGMFKGQYDVSEMSLGELIYYTSRGNADFVAIPVFPSRMFRHGFIFCRKNAGIETRSDLSGRKIGFLRWVQTAAIWMRGMLVDSYGVSVQDSQWYVASIHHWDDHDPGATVEPRDGSVIRMIENSGKNTSEHPELPAQFFQLYSDAKRWAQRWRRTIPSLVEAWPNHYLAEARGLFQSDPPCAR
jgi:4,5-dihydroxyphthalate decarboxylase